MTFHTGAIESELERVHAETVHTRRRRQEYAMPAAQSPTPVSAETLLRHAYGMRNAAPDSRAGKVVRGAKIAGGGLLLGMTMLGGLYLSRKITAWKKPPKEREHVEFLSLDWETIVTVGLAVAIGAGFTWLVMKWVQAEHADEAAKQQIVATLTPPTALPAPPPGSAPAADPIDQMIAELENDGAPAAAPIPAPAPDLANVPALGF